uniref:Uncharacterized protein LOC111110999 isoform X1 n=1 Tax=Crassostrea virginica TaxID=6565 RepID=A0A8B8BKQ8_CRAVI|nr:uncharacterized protein LOC111110999 isoform X1 [Crassostrea virginica]
MNTWSVILTWICLTTNCRSDDNDVRTMDRRLLLNDPNTLLSHIEALQREVTSLKSQEQEAFTLCGGKRAARRSTEQLLFTQGSQVENPMIFLGVELTHYVSPTTQITHHKIFQQVKNCLLAYMEASISSPTKGLLRMMTYPVQCVT